MFDTLHMVRDGAAFSFVQGALDLEYAGVLFNFDPTLYKPRKSCEPPELTACDLVVSVTRPAIDGDVFAERGRRLSISNSTFELKVLRALQDKFFDKLTRGRVVLSSKVKLPASAERYRDVTFAQRDGAFVRKLGDAKPSETEPFTVGYTCFLPSVGPTLPCAFLTAFGLDGTGTQALAYLVANHGILHDIISSKEPRLLIHSIGEISRDRQEVPHAMSDLRLKATIIADVSMA